MCDEITGKPVIYQLFVRLFGNKKLPAVQNGTMEENGCGKFNDVSDAALKSIKEMGVTHIWFTGVLEHATMSDFTSFNIQPDDWRLVKGRAGSPFAIKDYFDVSPDLAENVSERINEFEQLLQRTHAHGLKAIIDFIPNHVARGYHSESDDGKKNFFGAFDDSGKTFDPQNNFYYLADQSFYPPPEYQPLGTPYPDHMITHVEMPARVTGNNVLSSSPSTNDWFETVKLNFGVDIFNDQRSYFNPVPRTWHYLREVLLFWIKKGVDGFRCDMAEMIPVEFWHWLITDLKQANDVLFIAEVYERTLYPKYIYDAGFDYLYDKAGLYDGLISVLKGDAPAWQISDASDFSLSSHLLNFMENHDEVRLASPSVCNDAWSAMPAVMVSALLSKGAFMIYNGQEAGETAMDAAGFGGGNGRTTIYDYWHLPQLQKWVNNGLYDGGDLSASQKQLRKTYSGLLHLLQDPVFAEGGLYILRDEISSDDFPAFTDYIYAFVRYNEERIIVACANFNREHDIPVKVSFTNNLLAHIGATGRTYIASQLFADNRTELKYQEEKDGLESLDVILPLSGTMIFELKAL
jgi:glycosidase